MSQVQTTEESFLLPAIARAWRATVSALLFIGAVTFVIRHFNTLWSASIDLAHHYSVVAYIASHFRAPVNVPHLGDMNIYPHYSHALAAILGSFLGSPLMGLQLVTLLSIYSLWTAIAIALGTLPQRQAWIFLPVFAVLLALNRFGLHAELFGREVISNFFFAELVAQALCAWVFTLMLLMERRGTSALIRYAFCVVALHFAVRVHLLPTIELFGSLGLLVVLEVAEADQIRRLRAAVYGGIALIVGGGVIVLDPTFAAMRKLSTNNGAIHLHLLPNLLALALLAIVVTALSLALALQWFAGRRVHPRKSLLAHKYFACFGAATAILCLLQMLLLRWDMGSEYACLKYAFALQTVLLVDLALLICAYATRNPVFGISAIPRGIPSVFANLSPFLLVALGLVLGFAPPHRVQGQDLGHLVSIERTVTAVREVGAGAAAGKQDYVVDIAGIPWTDDYLYSIGLLEAPSSGVTRNFIMRKPIRDPERIGRIVTSVGSRPWDVSTCRRQVYAGGLVELDGTCVMSHISVCGAGIDFSEASYLSPTVAEGFNGPEPTGRWSQGLRSSITCTLKLGSPRPTQVLIQAQGHLSAGPQRMLVSINGGPDRTFEYSRQTPLPVIRLDISKLQGDQLQLKFKYPDAQRSSDRDLRVISIFFHKILFR